MLACRVVEPDDPTERDSWCQRCGAQGLRATPSFARSLTYPWAGGRLWALKSVVIDRLSITWVAASLGASRHTVNDAVLAAGRALLIDDPTRPG